MSTLGAFISFAFLANSRIRDSSHTK